MSRYLLDTNIVSYLLKQSFPALSARLKRMAPHQYAICSITEAELRFGAALLPAEARVHRLLPEVLDSIEIQPWDSKSAQSYALLTAKLQAKGQTMSNFGVMIAAHALAHGFVLVTHDKAFGRIRELKVEDWTKGPQKA